MSRTLEEIAAMVNPLDIMAFKTHRQATGHKNREVCDGCPQPITDMIVKYGESNGVKPRRKKGSFYN